jgi:hypothetical protein
MSVPNEIRELLETRIDTFEKLDVVVALHAADHQTATADALVRDLGLPRDVLRQVIGDLRRARLIDADSNGEIRLLPPNAADREMVRALVDLYSEDRSDILRVLGEIAMARIRGMAARTFADAFVIGNKKKGNEDG